MKIESIAINTLRPAEYNPRIIDPEVLESLKKSITEFGLVEPIIVNEDLTVIGGHQRLEALKALGKTEASCIKLNITKDKERLLNLALNKIQGDWDFMKLKEMLMSLDSEQVDLNLSGFDPKEIESIVSLGADMLPDSIGKDADESLDVFLNNSIKQIVLYFKAEEYEHVIQALREITENQHFENNTQVFMWLLKNYEHSKASRRA